MRRRRLAGLLMIGMVPPALFPALAPAQAPAQPPASAVKPQDILEVIEALKANLLRQQQPDGAWPDIGWNAATNAANGGQTAVICWALLQTGQEPFSDPIIKAVGNLLSLNMMGTYNRSLRCMVLASLARVDAGGKYSRPMVTDAEYLLQARLPNGRWSYLPPSLVKKGNVVTPDRSMIGDNSNTQFAVLALREAALSGAPIPATTWRETRDYWEGEQNGDGGFGYHKGGSDAPSYGSMTAAGTASLFIAEDMIRTTQCCKGQLPESIGKALEWLNDHFSATDNPLHGGYWLYWLYSVERVAETSGYRFFGDHDWFTEGAAAIIKAHREDQLMLEGLYDGAFALIFLSKSVAPMVCNKLEFADAWNPNPLDASHITRYLGNDVFERHLNWQVLKLEAPLSTYQEAPILLVTTKKWPAPDDPLSATLRDKIRAFCETGGTVLVDHTCTPDPQFAASFRAFLEKTWPNRRLRRLPDNHPVYSAQFALESKLPLQGLGNGCREYVLLGDSEPPAPATRPAADTAAASRPAPPPDLSCTWQKLLIREQLPAFQIAANLYMYATDKSFRNKIQPRSDLPRSAAPAGQSLPVAHLRHPNNWDACPLALPMLSEALNARAGLALDIQPATLDPRQLFGRRVLVISGQGRLGWTPEQIAAVRDFVKGGGLVLADALMGDRDFADSLRRLAAAALMAPARPVPDGDPLITGRFSPQAFNLSRVQYSRTLRWRKGIAGPAVLEGVQRDGRWVFLISPYDLTNGLTTAKPYGAMGYEPDDATRIAANAMLYFAGSAGPGG